VMTASSALVPDEAYPAVAVAVLRSARRRCLVSMFIYEVTRLTHPALLELCEVLTEAHWRGADVRVVIGGSRENYSIASAAASARAVLTTSGVPARWLSAKQGRGSHAKLVIADDTVVIGSHNWSPGAFDGSQIQDSVAVKSSALAGTLQMQVFELQWHAAVS
jgi:phosphatidylserine/phosphatidylglycerophosphate/cardiolipin synthase-like enzyme